jgi:hypothetical protein
MLYIFKNINLKLFKLIASKFDCCRHWQMVLGSTLLEKETLFPYLAKIRKKLPKYTECFFCTLSGKLKTYADQNNPCRISGKILLN